MFAALSAFWLAGLLLLVTFSTPVFARGTIAGTVVNNQASVFFSNGGVAGTTARSNTVSFTVIELIDLSLQSVDASAVAAASPDTAVPLTFRLTNLGNGPEVFRLDRVVLAAPGDFTPTPSSVGPIFIENGLQPGFQATGPYADTRYVAGTNDIALAPDGTQTLYLADDLAANLANGAQGRASLRATATTPGAAGATPGTALAGQGVGGAVAVVGLSSGTSDAVGTYIVTGLRVLMTKVQSAVRSPNGGTDLVPGAQCDYTIDVQLQGTTGEVDNFVISDPLPVQLNYLASTLKINGVAMSDAADSDAAQVINQQITVNLGKLVPGNHFVITYTTQLQ